MTRELPARPSLQHLKAQAKDLLSALRAGAPEARERFRQGLPAARGASDAKLADMGLALHDAQSVIAREYGFASWPELKAAVEGEALDSALQPPLSLETLRTLLQRAGSMRPPEVDQALLEASGAPPPAPVDLPAELPVVPLRDTLLSVGALAPIMIGRASSSAAVQAAEQAERRIALFGQKNELDEAPGVAGLHPVGCIAALHAFLPAAFGGWLIVRALQWVRLARITSEQPYLCAQVERFEVQEQYSPEVQQLEQRLRERVRAFIATLPDAQRLRTMTDGMSPLQLADASIANLTCSVEARAMYAAESDLAARLRHVLQLFGT
jgi:Lon protease-like protein